MRKITDPTQLAAFRLSCVPTQYREVCQHIKCKTGDAEAWAWIDIKGQPCAIAFFGRAQHSYSGRGASTSYSYFWFRTTEKREAFIAQCFSAATEREARRETKKAETKAKRATPHGLSVGDVLRSSWGYDQTNIDYYQITKLVGSCMVEFREIACMSQETMSMQGESVPDVGNFCSEAKRARVSDYGKRDSIRVHECAHAYRMEPKVIGTLKVYGASHWTAYA